MGKVFVLLWACIINHVCAVSNVVEHLSGPRGLAVDVEARKMYWAEVGAMKLRRANLDGTEVTDLVVKTSTKEAPYGVALDTENQKVYWTSHCCTIRRANLDGTGEEPVVNASFAGGIALDTLAGKVYWTDWMAGRLWRANTDGTEKEAVISGLSSPVDVSIDVIAGKVYWADTSRGRIERGNLDGTNSEVLNVSWATISTNGIALDPQNKKIYLTDYENNAGTYRGRIHRARVDGEDSEVLVSEDGMQMPFSIAVDTYARAVFWTDNRAGVIQRLALYCAAGTLEVITPTNATKAYVSHGGMMHGSYVTAYCPPGFHGSVRIACNDGRFYVSSGQCSLNCPAGHATLANGLWIAFRAMTDGDTVAADCPRGLIGQVQVSCRDGRVSTSGGECLAPRPCDAGRVLVDMAFVSYGALPHGTWSPGTCPEGFEGRYVLECHDGAMSVQSSSKCRATCGAGSLWVDGGNVEVTHGSIAAGKSVRVICPTRSAGDGVTLSCTGGFIEVNGTCHRTVQCPAGVVLVNGIQVGHPILDGLPDLEVPCPGGYSGSVNLTCDGGARVIGGSCHANCKEGWADIKQNVGLRHYGARHGQTFVVDCPDKSAGRIPLRCWDGNVTVECLNEPDCLCLSWEEGGGSLPLVALIIPIIAGFLVCGIAVFLYRIGCRELPPPSLLFRRSSSMDVECEEAPNPLVLVSVDALIPSPTYWATRDGVHIYQDPNRIKEVQDLMTDTWRKIYTRDRKLIAGEARVPVGCRVVNVLRVENHKAYDKYWQYKARLRELRVSGYEPFPTLTRGRLNELDESLNERYLFHGTNPESAHAIARDVFRIDKAGSCAGCMFGPGIYLAENASKSDEYAKEGGGVYLGLCAMLLCRALLGKVLTVSTSRDCSAEVKSGEYDCVCGDRLSAAGTFREMIFFNPEALYAEFIVIYARVYGDD